MYSLFSCVSLWLSDLRIKVSGCICVPDHLKKQTLIYEMLLSEAVYFPIFNTNLLPTAYLV